MKCFNFDYDIDKDQNRKFMLEKFIYRDKENIL